MGQIYVGIGGWNFAEWRGVFYPQGLSQKQELHFASRSLTSIEINSTYYGSQKPESFAKWHDETPDDFIFAVKGPRFATNRRVLADAGESVERFFASGVVNLKNKLGPVNWQLAATKTFDPDDMAVFFSLLPKTVGGLTIRHAIEARHESFNCTTFKDLVRQHGIGIITAADSDFPHIADEAAPFSYLRIMGTKDTEPAGYSHADLDAWAQRIKALASGDKPRDVFLYVISGHKALNPAAAMGIIERLRG